MCIGQTASFYLFFQCTAEVMRSHSRLTFNSEFDYEKIYRALLRATSKNKSKVRATKQLFFMNYRYPIQ